MVLKRNKKTTIILFCIAGTVIIYCVALVIFNIVLRDKVRQKLQELSPGVQVSFSSIHSGVFSSSLSINNLNIVYKPDSNNEQHRHLFYFPSVTFSGVNFFKLIFNKELSVNTVRFEKGGIKLDQFLLNKKDSTQRNIFGQIPFRSLSINHFELAETNVWLNADHENYLLLKGSITLSEINIDHLNKPFSLNNFHFKSIENSLSSVTYSIPGTHHILQLKKLVMNSEKGTLQIDSLKIIPENNTRELGKKIEQHSHRIEATISEITVVKLDFMQLLSDKFIAEEIIINETNAHIFSNNKNLTEPLPAAYLKEIPAEVRINTFKIKHSSVVYKGSKEISKNEMFKGGRFIFGSIPFRNILINNLEISGTNLSVFSNETNLFRLKGDINIYTIEMGSLNRPLKDSGFHFAAVDCDLPEIDYSIPNAYHNIQIKKLVINSKRGTAQIGSLKIIPQYGKFDLGEKLGHQADYINGTISNIDITKLDVMKLPDKKIIAEKIFINQSKLYVFRDRRLTRNLKPQPLPMAYLKSIPLQIRVKIFQVDHSSLEYEEFPKDGLQTGILKVESGRLSLSPFINHPQPSDADHIDMNVEGSLMGSGTVSASIYLPFSTQKDYVVKGAFKNLDLTTLNPSAENLGKFHIESGMLNNLSFQFTLNDEKATGKIIGEYHNLVIDKLKGNDKKIAKVPSFMLKNLIIPKNKDHTMPEANRTGIINYKNDPTRFVSFYLLKALLSGIRSSFTLGFLLPK